MNNREAQEILKSELDKYRRKLYRELKDLVDNLIVYEITASSGAKYQLEIQILWDDKPDGNIRVIGSIDDGRSIRAFVPLTDDFIKNSSNNFVDE